jgi:MATE family multidrug resistance protein
MAGFSWFAAQGARMGDVTLAANAVLLNLQTFMAYALDAFAFAAEVLVGSAVGAGDPRAVRAAVRATTVWAGGIALLFCIVWFAVGGSIIGLLTDLAPVRAAARLYLPYAAALPIVSVWSFQLDGIFLGATRTAAMRNAMIASLALFVTLAWALVPPFGNDGLWSAFLAFMAARGLTLAVAYPRLLRALHSAARSVATAPG